MEADQEAEIRRVQLELEKMLAQIEREIPVYLFTKPGENDVFSEAARQGLRFFRQLTDRIKLRETGKPAYPWRRHYHSRYPPEIVQKWKEEVERRRRYRAGVSRRSRR